MSAYLGTVLSTLIVFYHYKVKGRNQGQTLSLSLVVAIGYMQKAISWHKEERYLLCVAI